MALYPFRKMLNIALSNGFAVGYFEAWDENSMEAVVKAAEEENSPVIIGFGCMMVSRKWMERWGVELFASIGKVFAKNSRVPVSLILNEARSYGHCTRGIELGFNVVMLDSSSLPLEKNIEINKKLVRYARRFSAGVEAELGELPVGSASSSGRYTDPEEAKKFVTETGVDALAVSIGNVHILTEGKPEINFTLLEDIHRKVDVPLVIHGGSGFPSECINRAISLGVSKFNVGTILKKVYLNGIREEVCKIGSFDNVLKVVGSHGSFDITRKAQDNLKRKVREFMRLYGSSNRAHLFTT